MDSQGREERRAAQKARVKVAIRVRPFIEKERNEEGCIDFRSDCELVIGGDRSYKFDRVFREDCAQAAVYEQCIRELVLSCFDGYNAAVLAYGQTGSGKTFTMGTAASNFADLASIGIIPRTVYDIFREVDQRRDKTTVEVRASFIEIYNEQIIDLLADHLKDPKHQNPIAIREEKDGSVTLTGVNEEVVTDADHMFRLLEGGGKNRTTASTLMNDASSRSHAIFTMTIKQSILIGKGKEQEEGTITAKFFFVDLAGSERAKKTGATGAVLKEGININLGLLELGNVISALSTIDKNREQFITYRNSKLTRILQDCLGGNSNTYMIACVSPAESNYEESLNTLKYASKAMNIKNTPIVNRDEKTQLRQRILELEEENRRLRTMLAEKGVRLEDLEPPTSSHSNEQLKKLREQLKLLNRKLGEVSGQLQVKSHKLNQLEIKAYETRREKEVLQLTIEEMIRENPQLAESEASLALKERLEESEKDLPVLEKYMAQVQALEQRLADRESLFNELQMEYNKLMDFSKKEEAILLKKVQQLQQATRENQRLREELKRAAEGQTIQLGAEEEEVAVEAEAREDAVIAQGQRELQEREEAVRQEILQVDRNIEEREKFLEKMSRENVKLGSELVSSLNHNYHEKIVTLERERKGLLKQREEVGAAEKARLAGKIESLESELRDFRKKDKEQRKKERQLEAQSTQIRLLGEEIAKFKVQRAALDRKWKEERSQFDKLKSQRVKQLMAAKKEALKKDGIIRKLTIDNFKNAQFTRKKDEEIRKVKRLNEALKTIVRPAKRTPNPQQRASLTHSTALDQSVPVADETYLEQEQLEAVERFKQQILMEIQRENALKKYEAAIHDSSQQLELLYADDAAYRIQLERLQLQQDERELTEDEADSREQLKMRVEELKERIASCADSLKYSQAHYSAILGAAFEPFDTEAQVVYHPAYNSVPALRVLVKALFLSLKNLLFENSFLLARNSELEVRSAAQAEEIIGQRQQIIALNAEYCRNIAQAREQQMLSRLEEQDLPPAASGKRLDEKERRQLQRRIQDLSKTNRQIAAELEKNRRKCEVVQEKYQSIKNLVSKDKNIGTQQLPSFTKPDRRPQLDKNKLSMEELDGMLDSIDRLKKVKSSTNLDDYMPEHRQAQERPSQAESANRWECVSKIDAHNSSILSVAVHESLLVSSATKNIRVWDLESRKLISDLTGPQLAGSVKFVLIDPVRGLFLSACEKTVTIWDLVTLEVQGTLRCHKDEVRTMHIHGDYIFTGGKGTANGGSLLVWDLRKLNPNQALEEKEKNQDIFTFTAHENILYYGTRNHSIRRMNTSNFDILSPFEPPHLDAVTGLTVSRGRLISGSKDKHLRLWSLEHSVNNARHTLHVFNDYVNALHSPPAHSLIYAGSKDGQVKACFTRNDKIEILSGILTHTQSVNALATLYENPYGLVTASQDKTIKIWQPTRDTLENIARENYF